MSETIPSSSSPLSPTSVAPKTVAATPISNGNLKRPKRPLSGYNLYYRYKRMKILEATAHFKEDGNDNKDEAPSKSTIIRNTIKCLPGLESTPNDVIVNLPPQDIDNLRGSNIRLVLDGKIFPNENARSRIHRKVHGIGFVEMGSIMRDMWANVDDYTKRVFNELADVGRVRYRKLLSAYKAEEELMNNALRMRDERERKNNGNDYNQEKEEGSPSPKKKKKVTVTAAAIKTISPRRMSSLQDYDPQVTPHPAVKPNNVLAPFVTPVVGGGYAKAAVKPKINADNSLDLSSAKLDDRGPLTKGSLSSTWHGGAPSSPSSFRHPSLSINDKNAPYGIERRVSVDIASSSLDGTSYPSSMYGRSLSTGLPSSLHYTQSSSSGMHYRSLPMPPPPLYYGDASHVSPSSSNSHEEEHTTTNTSATTTTSSSKKRTLQSDPTVSAQDFLQLIDVLQEESEKEVIFGLPIFDVAVTRRRRNTPSPSLNNRAARSA